MACTTRHWWGYHLTFRGKRNATFLVRTWLLLIGCGWCTRCRMVHPLEDMEGRVMKGLQHYCGKCRAEMTLDQKRRREALKSGGRTRGKMTEEELERYVMSEEW